MVHAQDYSPVELNPLMEEGQVEAGATAPPAQQATPCRRRCWVAMLVLVALAAAAVLEELCWATYQVVLLEQAGAYHPGAVADECCSAVVAELRSLLADPPPDLRDAGPRIWLLPWRKAFAMQWLDTACVRRDLGADLRSAVKVGKQVARFVDSVPATVAKSYLDIEASDPVAAFLNLAEQIVNQLDLPTQPTQNSSGIAGVKGKAGECASAGALAQCTYVPAFAPPLHNASLPEQLHMKQATVAAMIRSVLISELGDTMAPTDRWLLFYRAYQALSDNRAGVYYPDVPFGDLLHLAKHADDILMRCKGRDCAYAKGLAHEREVGAIRCWNALESLLVYTCFDLTPGICSPYFTPILGVDGTISAADFWAIHNAWGQQNFGEAIWLPRLAPDGTTEYCAAQRRFTPNAVSKSSY